VGSAKREAAARYELALVAAANEEWHQARAHGQESLRLFEQIGHYQTADVQRWLEELAIHIETKINDKL
jgi:hypothetical protein